LVVKVASPLADGVTLTNGTSSVASAQTSAVSGPAVTTTVASPPPFTLSATDSPDPGAGGANGTYTVSYSNTGTAHATSVVLTDAVPANTTFVSATGSGTVSSGVVTWNLGTVNAGASGSVQMVVKVASPLANGTILTHGTYSLSSAQTGPVSGVAITTTVAS